MKILSDCTFVSKDPQAKKKIVQMCILGIECGPKIPLSVRKMPIYTASKDRLLKKLSCLFNDGFIGGYYEQGAKCASF